jgi:hypothetical protein
MSDDQKSEQTIISPVQIESGRRLVEVPAEQKLKSVTADSQQTMKRNILHTMYTMCTKRLII